MTAAETPGKADARPAFHALVIASVERDAAGATHVTFAVPDQLADAFRFRPGQHVTLRTIIDGEDVRRSYSLSSAPGAPLTVTVKRIDGGHFSTFAHDNLRVGMVIDVMPPAGRFTLPSADGAARTYLAIAAGSGITPVMSMIRHGLAAEPAARFILIYGNRSTSTILFRDALDDLKDRAIGRLSIVHVLSAGDEADVPMLAGRIDAAKLTALVPKLVRIEDVSHAVLCGPDTLIKTAMQTLQGLGLPRERIGFEFFVRGREERVPRAERAARAAVPTEAVGSELVVSLDGTRRTIRMRPDETVLAAALRVGVNAPYSCTGGMCCTCRAKLVEGTAPMTANFSLEAWEEAAGFILTCQARPTSARVVVDYDQV